MPRLPTTPLLLSFPTTTICFDERSTNVAFSGHLVTALDLQVTSLDFLKPLLAVGGWARKIFEVSSESLSLVFGLGCCFDNKFVAPAPPH